MRRLFGNFSWILSGTAVSTGLRAITLLLLVRAASPAQFAMYAGTYGLLVFGKALADLGLTKLITRDRALDSTSKTYGHALRLNTLTSFVLGVVGTVVLLATAIGGVQLAWALLPMAAAAAFEKNADTWCTVHLADGKAHLVALYTFGRRLVTFSLFVGLLYGNAVGPILSMTLAELAAAFLSMVAVRRSVGRTVKLPSTLSIGPTFRVSRSYWVHGLAMNVRNLDVSIVAMFAPVEQSGYFAAATRLSGPLQLVPSTLASVLLPHAARIQSPGRSSGRVIWASTLLFLPVCSALAYFIPELVPLLIGPDYKGAILCIQIIILGLPLSVYANLTSAALQGAGFAGAVSRVSWAYALLLIFAVAAGASFGGADGAGIGTVVANGFLAVAIMCVWNRNQKSGH